jgi:hypothetical protein
MPPAPEFRGFNVFAPFVHFGGHSIAVFRLKLPPGIKQQSPASLLAAVSSAPGLDSGEAAALSLAVETGAPK